MSASLIVLVPLVLLGVVTTLCFVGCTLPVTGLPGGAFTAYRSTITGNDSLVAFWPLDDADQSPHAQELKGQRICSYITVGTDPGQFPDPAIANVSAPAPGNVTWLQPGIVAGDVIGGNPNIRSPCIRVDGGYVSVQPDATLNPASFTVEAWVRVDWTDDPVKFPPAFRTVIDSRAVLPGSVTGFALFATPDNKWAVEVGGGAAGGTILTGEAVSFDSKPTYVAATFDAGTQTLTLFVNGMRSAPPMGMVAYVQNTTASLFIGTGAPSFPLRPKQPPNTPLDQTAPLTPFLGAIEDVAIYDVALPGGTMNASDAIFTHAQNGNGKSV